jgi:NTP pyrophosphatase (non-canonical NTP hydrolase)
MKKLFREVKELNKLDEVGPEFRLAKLFEESGELARAVNMDLGRKKHNLSKKEVKAEIAEEAADTIQCIFSLIDYYGITHKDVKKNFKKKNAKWKKIMKQRKKSK